MSKKINHDGSSKIISTSVFLKEPHKKQQQHSVVTAIIIIIPKNLNF